MAIHVCIADRYLYSGTLKRIAHINFSFGVREYDGLSAIQFSYFIVALLNQWLVKVLLLFCKKKKVLGLQCSQLKLIWWPVMGKQTIKINHIWYPCGDTPDKQYSVIWLSCH